MISLQAASSDSHYWEIHYEELILYMIEMTKRVKKLEQENVLLQDEINTLKKDKQTMQQVNDHKGSLSSIHL